MFHVQHVWEGDDAAFFAPGTPGVEIHEAVRPPPASRSIEKAYPNSFRETASSSACATPASTDWWCAG